MAIVEYSSLATESNNPRESAVGQSETFSALSRMSAVGGRADEIEGKADIAARISAVRGRAGQLQKYEACWPNDCFLIRKRPLRQAPVNGRLWPNPAIGARTGRVTARGQQRKPSGDCAQRHTWGRSGRIEEKSRRDLPYSAASAIIGSTSRRCPATISASLYRTQAVRMVRILPLGR